MAGFADALRAHRYSCRSQTFDRLVRFKRDCCAESDQRNRSRRARTACGWILAARPQSVTLAVRALTQVVTGAVLRGHISNDSIDGMCVESRHVGDVVAIFNGDPYRPSLRIEESVPMTTQHPEVIRIAEELELSI